MSKTITLRGGLSCTVDDDDFASLSKLPWHLSGGQQARYAATSRRTDGKVVSIRMHNLILPVHPPLIVDHVNGNCLDNRRSNLRLCTRTQNQWNRHAPARGASRFTGVCKNHARWRARISEGNKLIEAGSFAREVDAAIAYDEKCRELRGQFVRPNFSLTLAERKLRDWVSRTGGRFFSVCFIKRTDGSERVMLCRTGVTPLPGPSIIKITHSRRLISVWDVQAREFRYVPLEGILWIRFNNTYIRAAHRSLRSALDATTQGLLFARTAG